MPQGGFVQMDNGRAKARSATAEPLPVWATNMTIPLGSETRSEGMVTSGHSSAVAKNSRFQLDGASGFQG